MKCSNQTVITIYSNNIKFSEVLTMYDFNKLLFSSILLNINPNILFNPLHLTKLKLSYSGKCWE